ncbi:MAG: glycerophosphodiester phosphodiesterase family protein, partial [Angustibacter sp.]
MPQFRREHAFGPSHTPIVLAHRGYSPAGLENTMVAFSAAVELGVTYLETD